MRHPLICFRETNPQAHLSTLDFSLISAAISEVKHSPMVVELDSLKVWQSFKLLGLKRQRPTSRTRRLLRDLGYFHHQTHYTNRQSGGPLCQRAAAAFRGSVQDHQVLMSQERKSEHRHHTLHFTPAHSSQPYMQHSGAPPLSADRLCFLCISGRGFQSTLSSDGWTSWKRLDLSALWRL